MQPSHIDAVPDEVLATIFGFLHINDRQQAVPQVCKRWKQLCSAHPDTQQDLAFVICEATQRDWVRVWPNVRAPHATSVLLQALCRPIPQPLVVKRWRLTVCELFVMLAAKSRRLESLHVCTRPCSTTAGSIAGLPAMESGVPLHTRWLGYLAPGAALTRICFQDLDVPQDMDELNQFLTTLTKLRDCFLGFAECKMTSALPLYPVRPGFPVALLGCSQLTSLQLCAHDDMPSQAVPFGTIPEGISRLTALERLVLLGTHRLISLPESISRLQRLRSLEVLKGFTGGSSGSGFTLPTGLSQLTALMCLAVSTDYLGAGLLQLTGLRSLMLHRLQSISHAPPDTSHTLQLGRLSALDQLTELRISCSPCLWPLDIASLAACTTLQRLRLDRNNLRALNAAHRMERLMALPSLTMLDFAANQLTEVPSELEHATALRVLDLSFNPLGKWDNSPLKEAEQRLKGLNLEVLGLRQTQEWQQPCYPPRPKPYKWQRTPWQQSASLQDISIPVVLMGGAEQTHPELDAGDELRSAYMPFAFWKQEYGPNCDDSSSDDGSEEEDEW